MGTIPMEKLAKQHALGVLATVSGGRPHCSLMAYATDEACRRIYMVTHKNTRKFQNLVSNPYVSLLVDTRASSAGHATQALTIEGVCEPVTDPEHRLEAKGRLLAAHPDLREFMDHPEAEVICVRIRSFLLLNGLTDARFKQVDAEE